MNKDTMVKVEEKTKIKHMITCGIICLTTSADTVRLIESTHDIVSAVTSQGMGKQFLDAKALVSNGHL